jgi:hypothetical protein
MPNEVINIDTPSITITRNKFGLISGLNYTFNENGTINWRKMIKSEFLVPNKQVFSRKNKPLPTSIDGLDDSELLILLGGIKDLAQIRGFTSVEHRVSCPSSDYVVSVCKIAWLPNYETEGYPTIFSSIGDASPLNTNGFGRNYLGPIAENRAFVRCVRCFLKVNIVSQEEIGGNASSDPNEDMAVNLLKETMNQFNVSLDTIKARLIKDKFEGAETLTSVDQIPRYKQFELIERIKKNAEAKKATASA